MSQAVEILVVEDSRTQAAQLRNLLEQHEFRVACVGNGVEALAAIRTRRPSLVMSDIVMPEMDGYQLCRQIKEDDGLKDIPSILMTTLADPREVIKALGSKADNFITKPCNAETLPSRIKHVLANQALRQNAPKDGSVEILYEWEKHRFASDPAQILDLLLSTFDNAIQKNLELEAAHDQQIKAHLALQKLNERLEEMNENLEEMVDARTQALALSDESHRALLDNNADAIIVVDQASNVRFG